MAINSDPRKNMKLINSAAFLALLLAAPLCEAHRSDNLNSKILSACLKVESEPSQEAQSAAIRELLASAFDADARAIEEIEERSILCIAEWLRRERGEDKFNALVILNQFSCMADAALPELHRLLRSLPVRDDSDEVTFAGKGDIRAEAEAAIRGIDSDTGCGE
jgi:hypothetical protein